MSSELMGLIMLVVGAVSVVFSEKFAHQTRESQRSLFGVDISLGFLRFGYIFGGILFCIVGALELLGVLEYGR